MYWRLISTCRCPNLQHFLLLLFFCATMERPPVPANCPQLCAMGKGVKKCIEGMLPPVWDSKRCTWGGLADLVGRVVGVFFFCAGGNPTICQCPCYSPCQCHFLSLCAGIFHLLLIFLVLSKPSCSLQKSDNKQHRIRTTKPPPMLVGRVARHGWLLGW